MSTLTAVLARHRLVRPGPYAHKSLQTLQKVVATKLKEAYFYLPALQNLGLLCSFYVIMNHFERKPIMASYNLVESEKFNAPTVYVTRHGNFH